MPHEHTPTREGETLMMVQASDELLQGLNHAFNREITTLLRYVQQASRIAGAQWSSVRDVYLREIPDELGHAQYLADKIVMLGGVPRLDPQLSPPPEDVPDMLRRDIEEERTDVQHYRRLAAMADEQGLADLKVRMEEQAADEARHGEQMLRLLG